MELEHSFTVPVPPEQAWQVLLDVEQVAPCMPGATIDSVDGDQIKGRIKVKVGPVSLTYSGTARFTERDEQARSVTLEASGKETRGAGTAAATVRSTLHDEGNGQTQVVVHTTMSVTGRPAQFGRGVMAEVGGRIIEKFAANLAAQLAGGSPPQAGSATGNGAGPGAPAPAPAAGSVPAAASGPAAGSGPGTRRGAAGVVPLEELNLNVRAYNSLRRVGIHSVDELSARTESQLLAVENLGPASVKEIKQRLADVGLRLASQPQDGQLTAGAGPSAPASATADGAPASGTTTGSAGTAAASPGVAGSPGGGRDAAAAAPPLWADSAPRAARPPDEDAIDLLSVAGFPVLKRALPAVGVLVALLLVVLGVRRRGRRRAARG
jgi:carbon monoxide dehydrogenase subunit G